MNNIYTSSIKQTADICHVGINIFTMPKNINLYNHIKNQINKICNINNIDREKQNYFISAYLQDSNISNNDIWYKTTKYKYFSFYGKYYIEDSFLEMFKIEDKEKSYNFNTGDLFLALDFIKNKTIVDNKKRFIEFYIVPGKMIQDFECGHWLPI